MKSIHYSSLGLISFKLLKKSSLMDSHNLSSCVDIQKYVNRRYSSMYHTCFKQVDNPTSQSIPGLQTEGHQTIIEVGEFHFELLSIKK